MNAPRIRNYAEAESFLGSRTSRIVRGKRNTRIMSVIDGVISMVYHSTAVVTWYRDGRVILRTAGYRTVTTKRRINEHTFARVFAKSFAWYVEMDGKITPYVDGMNVGIVKIHDHKTQIALF